MKQLDSLFGYIFHYNPYRKLWYGFKREDSNKYFNGNYKNVMKSESIEDLIDEILIKNLKLDE